jgi:hypothetical protein
LNVALFDVFSVLYSELDELFVEAKQRELRMSFYELMEDSKFVDAISSGTSDPRKVVNRFQKAKEAITRLKENDREA